jgi:hypothetical protein
MPQSFGLWLPSTARSAPAEASLPGLTKESAKVRAAAQQAVGDSRAGSLRKRDHVVEGGGEDYYHSTAMWLSGYHPVSSRPAMPNRTTGCSSRRPRQSKGDTVRWQVGRQNQSLGHFVHSPRWQITGSLEELIGKQVDRARAATFHGGWPTRTTLRPVSFDRRQARR